jgi:hypothetical protein
VEHFSLRARQKTRLIHCANFLKRPSY